MLHGWMYVTKNLVIKAPTICLLMILGITLVLWSYKILITMGYWCCPYDVLWKWPLATTGDYLQRDVPWIVHGCWYKDDLNDDDMRVTYKIPVNMYLLGLTLHWWYTLLLMTIGWHVHAYMLQWKVLLDVLVLWCLWWNTYLSIIQNTQWLP